MTKHIIEYIRDEKGNITGAMTTFSFIKNKTRKVVDFIGIYTYEQCVNITYKET